MSSRSFTAAKVTKKFRLRRVLLVGVRVGGGGGMDITPGSFQAFFYTTKHGFHTFSRYSHSMARFGWEGMIRVDASMARQPGDDCRRLLFRQFL